MNGVSKEIFKYSAIGVSLIGSLYIIYSLTMGILNIATNDLNHMDKNIEAQTEAIIRLDGKATEQIKILEKIYEQGIKN